MDSDNTITNYEGKWINERLLTRKIVDPKNEQMKFYTYI